MRIFNPKSKIQNLKSFTLIELLVVVTIIAVLVSILLPALNQARESARSAVCKSDMAGMGKAVFFYADENKDKIPPANVKGRGTRTQYYDDTFDLLLEKYLNTFKFFPPPNSIWVSDPGFWKCPSDAIKREVYPMHVQLPPVMPYPARSYQINFFLATDYRYDGKSVRLSQVPDRMVILHEYWHPYNFVREVLAAAYYTNSAAIEMDTLGNGHGIFGGNRTSGGSSGARGNFLFTDLSVENYNLMNIATRLNLTGTTTLW